MSRELCCIHQKLSVVLDSRFHWSFIGSSRFISFGESPQDMDIMMKGLVAKLH